MNKFLAILIIVVVVGLVIYYVQTPSFRQTLGIQNLFLFQNPQGSSSPFAYLFGGHAYDLSVLNATSSTSTAEEPTPPAPSSLTINDADIPFGFKRSQLSPYFHRVRITNAVPNGDQQQITLNAQLDNNTTGIKVTGWSLKANASGELIPRAIKTYNTLAPLQWGSIVLTNGQSLQIFSNTNPLGVNFRLNECTGYLNTYNYFAPQLPQDCPVPSHTDIFTFSGACQDYIMSLGQCQIPSLDAPVPSNDYACRGYLPKLTYEGCVTAHKDDGNFLGSEWWVWTDKPILDNLHDRVLLYDTKGLLVDEFDY